MIWEGRPLPYPPVSMSDYIWSRKLFDYYD